MDCFFFCALLIKCVEWACPVSNLCACTARRMHLMPVGVQLGGGCGTVADSSCAATFFFLKAHQIWIMNTFPSSARSTPRNSLGLSVEPGGACAVNPATPNLQGLGVCVYMCLSLRKRKGVSCVQADRPNISLLAHRRKCTKCSKSSQSQLYLSAWHTA